MVLYLTITLNDIQDYKPTKLHVIGTHLQLWLMQLFGCSCQNQLTSVGVTPLNMLRGKLQCACQSDSSETNMSENLNKMNTYNKAHQSNSWYYNERLKNTF